ncbi:MAG: hypothetical protein IPO60_12920 [Flavobacteriales bacterium]|jgi:hypothetical protein|nr:hypothetical protein [Flavobacteriales bacterium]MBK6892657.1 hypothetical protein [Flavobacteriales bacterium]MBK7246798.1 hypothetical protein [Flavobacteriales bacterium]MBK7286653.1 hypothetical protein [Flavobacteriales bacterium]MBK9061084.1 hypothetical protein [Flavobacteriales bacterium]
MKTLLHAIAVMTAAVVKFFFSAPLSYHQFGNNFWQTVLLIAAGGCIGMIVFFLGGARVLEWFRLRRLRKRAHAIARGVSPRRIFTRTNRFIVRLKHGYGIYGLALISPPILSIPLTALLAAKYFRHDRRMLPLLLVSVVLWSFVLSAAWKFTG